MLRINDMKFVFYCIDILIWIAHKGHNQIFMCKLKNNGGRRVEMLFLSVEQWIEEKNHYLSSHEELESCKMWLQLRFCGCRLSKKIFKTPPLYLGGFERFTFKMKCSFLLLFRFGVLDVNVRIIRTIYALLSFFFARFWLHHGRLIKTNASILHLHLQW